MSKKESKRFIDFLDNYTNNEEPDYFILTNIIQSHYLQMHDATKIENNVPLKDGPDNTHPPPLQDFYSMYDTSNWNIINGGSNIADINPYQLWQKQHEVNIASLTSKLSTENTIPTKYLHIDVSINSITDLISILDKYEYSHDTEYNIDLKALHNIKDDLHLLNNMIGMESMKQSILDQLLYFIQELHLNINVKSGTGKTIDRETTDFKHTVIYGPPGTGKTEVAKIIGKMYSKLGILKNNIFKKVTRNDLIAGYLGQTAIKTKKVIEDCLGGVLFIDEAYSLASSEKNDSFSKECIDILCEALSDHKNDLMVIIAGYEDELNDTFFQANAGLKSRFIWRFTMNSYNAKEMMSIFRKKVLEQEWSFEQDDTLTDKWFDERKQNFKHYGRDMELLFTFTKIAHGRRIYSKDKSLRKKISIADMKQGYDTFLKNINLKKEPTYMNSIYV